MNILSRIRVALVLVMLLVPLSACALTGGPVEGRVFEAETNKPLVGAIVVVHWNGTYSAIAETKTVCYHIETATTDAEGRYKIPAWSAKYKGPLFSPEAMLITAYKAGYETYIPPGYVRSEEYRKNIHYLKPFTGTREERFKYLFRLDQSTASCRSPEAGEKSFATFYRALYEEMKALAESREEADFADGYQRRAETLELGREEAERRARTRAEQRNRQPLKSDPSALEGIIMRPPR